MQARNCTPSKCPVLLPGGLPSDAATTTCSRLLKTDRRLTPPESRRLRPVDSLAIIADNIQSNSPREAVLTFLPVSDTTSPEYYFVHSKHACVAWLTLSQTLSG